MLLSDTITMFLTSMVSQKAPSTIVWYARRLPKLIEYFGDVDISTVTIDGLRSWRAYLYTRDKRYINHPFSKPVEGGYSPFTVHQFVRAAKAMFRWLHLEGKIPANTAHRLELPKLPKPKPRGIEKDHLVALINAVAGRPRDQAIMLFLADTGCRVGGLCGLRIKHLYLDERSADVTEKGEITRPVFFLPRTAQALRAWLDIRPNCEHDYLFTGYRNPHHPLLPGGVYQMLKDVSIAAGWGKGFNPHNFRHGVIRHWLNGEMSLPLAAQLAGHSNVEITGDIYGKMPETLLQAAHDRHSWLKALQV